MVKIDISDSALDYLKKLAVPLEDTTISVFDRIVAEHKAKAENNVEKQVVAGLNFGISDMPDVTFSNITGAKINQRPLIKKDWNTVFARMIEVCLNKGQNRNNLISLLEANIIQSEPDADQVKKGYKYIPKAQLSFQGLDAIRACKNIMILSQSYDIPVDLTIKWSKNAKADYPGKSANITLP